MIKKSRKVFVLILLFISCLAGSNSYALVISNAQIQYISCQGFCFQPGLTFTFDRDNTGNGLESNGIRVTDGNGNLLYTNGGASPVPSTTTIAGSWCITYNTPPQSNPITIQFISAAGNGFNSQIAYETSGICQGISSVPTLTEWGIVILTVLLGASSIYYLKRRKSVI